jgi:hypothetical protein
MSHSKLKRVCAACGVEKPLSAFLQFTGKGNTYGQICAACRAAGKTGEHQNEESAGGRAVSHGITNKERVFAETEQKKQIKDIKELYRQEINKKEEDKDQKSELAKKLEQERKDHRLLIEAKQTTFAEKKQEKLEVAIENTLLERQQVKEGIKQEDFVRRELQTTNWDMQGGYVDPQAALSKYKEGAFLQFKTWLGKSAHLSTTERIYNSKVEPAANKNAKENGKNKKEPTMEEYLDRRVGPGRKR